MHFCPKNVCFLTNWPTENVFEHLQKDLAKRNILIFITPELEKKKHP